MVSKGGRERKRDWRKNAYEMERWRGWTYIMRDGAGEEEREEEWENDGERKYGKKKENIAAAADD